MTFDDAIAAIKNGTKITMPDREVPVYTGYIQRGSGRCACGRLAKVDYLGRCFGCAIAEERRQMRFSLRPVHAWMSDESGPMVEEKKADELERAAIYLRNGVTP